MGKITKRSAAIVGGSILAVTGGTAAFAYASGWFTGTGSVAATSSEIKVVHAAVNLGNTPETRLYPGRTVSITTASVTNPNDYPVLVTGITVQSIQSSASGCGVGEADLSFGAVPNNTVVAAGATAVPVPLGSLTMAQTADPACANASITVTAALAGEISG